MSNAQRKALTTHRNRRRDSGVVRVEVQAAALDTWPDKVRAGFGGRILPVDKRVAEAWGELGIPDLVPTVDGLIAATALVCGLTMMTRNVRDLGRTGYRFSIHIRELTELVSRTAVSRCQAL